MAELTYETVFESQLPQGEREIRRSGLLIRPVQGLALWLVTADINRLPPSLPFGDGITLPTIPNRYTGTDPCALWLAPDSWLIVSARLDRFRTMATLEPVFIAADGIVSDVSDARAVVDIIGSAAKDLMAMGCALDIGAESFAQGAAVRTLFARLPAVITRHDEDWFRLYFDRTLLTCYWQWIKEAATAL